jgi:uncharacterized RDD family membrane protein YckC
MSTTGSNDSWSGTVPTYGASNSNLRLASFQHRLGSYALDCALAFVTLGIGWLIWSLIVWGQGQTPAKKILKLRVYAADNTQRPATWGHMAVREFLLLLAIGIAASVLNLFTFGVLGTIGVIAWYVMEIVWYFTKGQRTLRDTLVKTLVVNEA